MKFIALTIFPELFASFREHGIIRRAIQRNLISLEAVNIRDFASGKHRVTDDRPYGGGCGMVMKPEPLAAALRAARGMAPSATAVLLSPQGRKFNQAMARELKSVQSMVLLCGRYEGIDDRILHDHVDLEVSIGDYVLTGGELPAMIVIEAITRLIPGALGGESSADNESFSNGVLDCGHFTRPPEFEGQSPPGVLLSGDHRKIEQWRLESSLIRTVLKRKDLLETRALSREEIEILKNWHNDIEKIIRAQSSSGPDSPSGTE
ncbi:MAG: tRNA (guanine-N1)-methyltransferase [Deltaproteobacteria bacterium SG8_13]|nr:MAG: tRNA (guanine-N1)-methyltransferase [Deltaproteobacteria bacterium SG8_13]